MKNIILKNGMPLTINKVIPEEAEEIINFINGISLESENLTICPGEFDKNIEDEKKFIEKVSQSKNCLMISGKIDGKIVSLLNFNASQRKRIRHVGEFGISVKKELWNLGIGKEMLCYLIDWAKKTDIIKKINLMVRKDNISAVYLYKKFGFEVEGTNTRYFKIDNNYFDLLYMGLKID